MNEHLHTHVTSLSSNNPITLTIFVCHHFVSVRSNHNPCCWSCLNQPDQQSLKKHKHCYPRQEDITLAVFIREDCANITAYPPYLWQLIKWQPKHSSGFNSGMNKQTNNWTKPSHGFQSIAEPSNNSKTHKSQIQKESLLACFVTLFRCTSILTVKMEKNKSKKQTKQNACTKSVLHNITISKGYDLHVAMSDARKREKEKNNSTCSSPSHAWVVTIIHMNWS